jgi:hypothetical protein
MSTLSEQDHLNPREPLYYAPRWLRDRSKTQPSTLPEAGSDAPFSPASFDSRLESAVSEALRHPLDPEVMHEYSDETEPRKALWSVTARFAAAIGVSAVVALFFVIIVPASRAPDGEASTASTIVRAIKTAVLPSGQNDAPKPAISEFQSVLASAPAKNPATSEPSGQLLKQFMQWRQQPASTSQ